MQARFASVGHSNRPLTAFIDILREAGIGLVVDVRSFPKSRTNPVFNTDTLPDDLAAVQIGYRHMPDLGGRRPRQTDVPSETNALWRVQSFHNYADYALGARFGAALEALIALGRDTRLAMMCSEAVWWRCHRRIVTDHLIARGHAVDHLMGGGRIDAARLTPGAQAGADGRVIYPAPSDAARGADG
ncbi:hypothetical protein OCGS_2664 [Oceaniovalibus guishaninsula JLT2003]|uniref:HhH-GPD domain protein n=1 Tax=Oceaniovalibus guishaninsula JLT2003 TaxID=1231392 RepID=K2H657_9RHOB|nr:DUF488 domain-containing protein [Oceaniovalibus guishaninsula]EKE43073.1 hypothetical protein OCGS_2664 [Oceaniovalibus guishaninsula JLT2003]